MEDLLEPLRHTFLQRALLGCVLAGFTNGALSSFIVLRRMALMADALSHSLLPGLALGVLFFGLAPGGLFFGALLAALFVGLGATLLSRHSRIKEDTALAILYTSAFSAGLILLHFAPVPVNLHDYLFGNILELADSDLWSIYAISLLVLPTLAALQRPFLLLLFEPATARAQGVPAPLLSYLLAALLALSMIASLRAAGVVLALGLLTAPAATIYLFSDNFPTLFWGGGFLGMAGACAGLFLSYWLDLPSGACIVLLLGGVFCLAYLFSPKYGIFARQMHLKFLVFRRPTAQRHSSLEPIK